MNTLNLKVYGALVACTLLFYDVTAQQNNQLFFDRVDDVTTQINDDPYPIHVTGINYGDFATNEVSLKSSHNNPELIRNYEINSTSNGNAFIQYALNKNATGTAVFTIEMEVKNSAGKQFNFRRNFAVTVNSVLAESERTAVELTAPHIRCYPNPIGGEGTIEFSSPATGQVLIELYDLHGRQIRQLYRGDAREGMLYRLSLLKGQFAAGTYFLKLRSQSSSKSLKIVVSH